MGVLSYEDPNYNFLGNSIYYAISSEENDKPNQGYENSIQKFTINTGFEQYKDIKTTLGLSASYDDLQTDGTASETLKKQSGTFSEIEGSYAFSYDKRNRVFMPTRWFNNKFWTRSYLFILIEQLFKQFFFI